MNHTFECCRVSLQDVSFSHFVHPEEFSDIDFEDQLINVIPLMCLSDKA